MKKKVVIFMEKSRMEKEFGVYDTSKLERLNKQLNKTYINYNYDISVKEYGRYNSIHINKEWMCEHNPILIGFGCAANYVERMSDCDRKYLISPERSYRLSASQYDRENTYCLFGNDEKDLKTAEDYKNRYDKVFTDVCEDKLGFADAMGYINCYLSPQSLFYGQNGH